MQVSRDTAMRVSRDTAMRVSIAVSMHPYYGKNCTFDVVVNEQVGSVVLIAMFIKVTLSCGFEFIHGNQGNGRSITTS